MYHFKCVLLCVFAFFLVWVVACAFSNVYGILTCIPRLFFFLFMRIWFAVNCAECTQCCICRRKSSTCVVIYSTLLKKVSWPRIERICSLIYISMFVLGYVRFHVWCVVECLWSVIWDMYCMFYLFDATQVSYIMESSLREFRSEFCWIYFNHTNALWTTLQSPLLACRQCRLSRCAWLPVSYTHLTLPTILLV